MPKTSSQEGSMLTLSFLGQSTQTHGMVTWKSWVQSWVWFKSIDYCITKSTICNFLTFSQRFENQRRAFGSHMQKNWPEEDLGPSWYWQSCNFLVHPREMYNWNEHQCRWWDTFGKYQLEFKKYMKVWIKIFFSQVAYIWDREIEGFECFYTIFDSKIY